MAKKRRKEDEEEFKLPEFDEQEFLRKELISAKVMMLTIVLAIVAAILSYVLTRLGVVVVGFFAGLALVFMLRYLVRVFQIDTKGYQKKDWLGHGATFFFTWLAVWVLIMNIPFTDVTPPNLTVFVGGSQVTPPQATINKTVFNVTASAVDNAGIQGVWIQDGIKAEVLMAQQPGTNIWSYQVDLGGNSTRAITVTARDISGNPPAIVAFIVQLI